MQILACRLCSVGKKTNNKSNMYISRYNGFVPGFQPILNLSVPVKYYLFLQTDVHVLRVCPPQVSVFSVQILGNLECLCIDILVIDVLEFSVVFSNVF